MGDREAAERKCVCVLMVDIKLNATKREGTTNAAKKKKLLFWIEKSHTYAQ